MVVRGRSIEDRFRTGARSHFAEIDYIQENYIKHGRLDIYNRYKKRSKCEVLNEHVLH